MKNVNSNIRQVLSRVNRRQLNNTQRVLLAMLTNREEWVSRTSLEIPSASSRLRDLRKPRFGGFDVQCKTASELNKQAGNKSSRRPTFYRIHPRTITVNRVMKAFEGVILNTK